MSFESDFIVKPGSKVDLDKIDPGNTGKIKNKTQGKEKLAEQLGRITLLQNLVHQSPSRAWLAVVQAPNTGGKDGSINTIGKAMNLQGTRSVGFKEPSKTELAHDFLWRAHMAAPAKGEFVFFNRSYYEDVLIVRVHNLVPKDVWKKRYGQINDFEAMLHENGTRTLKFYLHIDHDEQFKRLKDRWNDALKRGKLAKADFVEHLEWEKSKKAAQDTLSKCSTKYAPWFVIPANNKWFAHYVMARIIADRLESENLKPPKSPSDLEGIGQKFFGPGGPESVRHILVPK